MMTKTTTIRAGTYHNAIFGNDPDILFDALQSVYDQSIRVSSEHDTRFYFLNELQINGHELIGTVGCAQKDKSVKTVSDKSNVIETEKNKNLVIGTVRFYMDRDNTIIMEEKSTMPRTRTAWAIGMLLSEYTLHEDSKYHPIFGRTFEVSFDRFGGYKASDFVESLKTLNKIEYRVNVTGNPFLDKDLEDLERALMEANAEKNIVTGKNINKRSLFVRAVAKLSEDGHVDMKLEGYDENDEKQTFLSNKDMDDQYHIERCKGEPKKFRESISHIIAQVRKNHDKS